jgi:hypothetical protein
MAKNCFKLLRFSLLLLFFAGCAGPVSQGDIADLHMLPQDARFYVSPATADHSLLEPSQQDGASRRFLDRYFSPWDTRLSPLPAKEAFAPLDELSRGRFYGGNLLPYGEKKKAQLAALCDRANYPSPAVRAITVRHADLRALPTREPAFLDPKQAGEGYPFDYFQYSAIRSNTPLRIRHRSADGAWYFVDTPHVSGWLPVLDVAIVDQDFISRFRSGHYLTAVRDKVPLLDLDGQYRQSFAIGALLPLAQSSPPGDWRVLIGVADANGKGRIREGLLPKDAAAPWPLAATADTISGLINQMLDQPYGWGGLCGNRDCSATLQDLFAAIGISLPRNSARQMKSGRTISLKGLSPEQKEKRLLAAGEPFMTLVGMPGHVMLYIGQREGQAVVFQTKWGVRTRSFWGEEGRHLVGRTVITSLQPGRELPDLAKPEGDLRWHIDAITFLEPEPVGGK